MTIEKGRKFDQGKPRFDLIEPRFLLQMARIMQHGAEKYEPNNWQGVDDFNARYTAALHRHINAWQLGESIDRESGEYHLAHAACNIMFLLWQDTGGASADQKLRREHKSNNSEINTGPWEAGQGSSRPNPDEELSLRNATRRIVAEILDSGPAYQSFRTRLNELCVNWHFKSATSPDNTASDGKLHERKPTLQRLSGHADECPF